MMSTVELHIITNCIRSAPDITFIQTTHASFCRVFGEMKAVVWCDPKPHAPAFNAFCKNIEAAGISSVIHKSRGLADAYLGIMKKGTGDFLFVLEHDWSFVRSQIRHDLNAIVEMMRVQQLYYLRFNQNQTAIRGMDRWLRERKLPDGFRYCLSPCWSGNPHILNRQKCLDLKIPERILARKDLTLERHLTNDRALVKAIYGPVGHPATIRHLDARDGDPKPFWDAERKKREQAKQVVHLGIVVPLYNLLEPERLKQRFLNSIENDAQPKISYEVLFVTEADFDITTLDKVSGERIFSIAKAYNAGLEYFKDRARFIACTDIDLLFPPGFLDHAVDTARQRLHMHLARYLIDTRDPKVRRWNDWLKEPTQPGTGAWNCMRYSEYHRIGGFNEDLYGWGYIDSDFTERKKKVFHKSEYVHDILFPLVHISHPKRSVKKRSLENKAVSDKYIAAGKWPNWLTGEFCSGILSHSTVTTSSIVPLIITTVDATVYDEQTYQSYVAALSNSLSKHVGTLFELWCVSDFCSVQEYKAGVMYIPANYKDERVRLEIFRPDINSKATGRQILAIDLNTLIVGSMDKVLRYRGPLTLLQNSNGAALNVVGFPAESCNYIYEELLDATDFDGCVTFLDAHVRETPQSWDVVLPRVFCDFAGLTRREPPADTVCVYFNAHHRIHQNLHVPWIVPNWNTKTPAVIKEVPPVDNGSDNGAVEKIPIVMPCVKSAWGQEIIYSAASIRKHFTDPFEIYVIGECPEVMRANVHYVPVKDDPAATPIANVIPKMEWAYNHFENFIWWADDMYLMRKAGIIDFKRPRHQGDLRGKIPAPVRQLWRRKFRASLIALKAAGFPTFDSAVHMPRFYNSRQLRETFTRFNNHDFELLPDVLYFNMWVDPRRAYISKDERLTIYTRVPSVPTRLSRYLILNHDDNGLTDLLKKFLKDTFGTP